MKFSLKSTFQTIKTNLHIILLFEVIYRTIAIVIFWEFSSRGLAYAAKMAGYSYLTQKNMLFFLIKPFTLLVLFGMLLVGILLVCVETSVLTVGFQASAAGQRMNLWKMVVTGMGRCLQLLRPRKFLLVFLFAWLFLAINFGFLYQTGLHIKPLNYFLAGIMSKLAVRIILYIALGIFILLLLPHVFAVFSMLFEHHDRKQSMKMSRSMVLKHWPGLFARLAAGNMAAAAMVIFLYLLALTVSVFLVKTFAASRLQLALVLMISDYLELGMLFFGSMVFTIVNLGMLTRLYYRYHGEAKAVLMPEYHYKLPGKIRRRIRAVLLAVWAAAVALYIYDMVYNGAVLAEEAFHEIQITSHRGSSWEAPENTIPAIELAVENLADFVEIDVQETKDGQVVLLHDNSLNRTTGIKQSIWNVTYDQLSQYDASRGHSAQYAGTRVPLLEDVFAEFKGRINFNIELKSNGHNTDLVNKVLDLIEEYDMERQVVLSSTSYRYLSEVKDRNPDLPTGYILSAAYGYFLDDDMIDFFSLRYTIITEALVERAHSLGKEIHVWTVNDKALINRMKRMGVDNIITDRPVLAREELYREKSTETVQEFLTMILSH